MGYFKRAEFWHRTGNDAMECDAFVGADLCQAQEVAHMVRRFLGKKLDDDFAERRDEDGPVARELFDSLGRKRWDLRWRFVPKRNGGDFDAAPSGDRSRPWVSPTSSGSS